MRDIRYIVIHCTAGSQKSTARDVIAYHTKTLGWSVPGYHFIIDPDGNITEAVPVTQNSNGVKGRNSQCINIAWIGGVDTGRPGLPPIDNRTEAQRTALRRLLHRLRTICPRAEILGHRDFPQVNKACPSFDARAEYSEI